MFTKCVFSKQFFKIQCCKTKPITKVKCKIYIFPHIAVLDMFAFVTTAMFQSFF